MLIEQKRAHACANFTPIRTKLSFESYCIHILCKRTRESPIPLCNRNARYQTCPQHVLTKIRSFNRASACQPESSIKAFAYANNKLAQSLTFMVSTHQMATQQLSITDITSTHLTETSSNTRGSGGILKIAVGMPWLMQKGRGQMEYARGPEEAAFNVG